MDKIQVIDQRGVLGKEFRIYGTFENPLFLAKDIAEMIGYAYKDKAKGTRNVNMMLKTLDVEDVIKAKIEGNNLATQVKYGGLRKNTEYLFITEDGLYEVLMQSRKPIAKTFKKEVKAILKSIRKHGAYMTESTLEKALTSPDFLIQLATNLKEEKQKRAEVERKLEKQKPLVQFATKIARSENSLLVREVAKIASKQGVTIGEKRLWNKLRDWKLIFKASTEPMQSGVDRGYFEVVESTKESGKRTLVFKTTRVTGKGQLYIISKLQKELMEV